jgi:WD40 repeat protein
MRKSSGSILSVAFAPDGGVLAAASPAERMVRVWDAKTGRLCREIEGHAGGTNAVAFSPEGSVLATAGNDGMVRLWRVSTGAEHARLDGRSWRLSQVAFSADGRTLAACGNDNHIRVWDAGEFVIGPPRVPDDRRKVAGQSRIRHRNVQSGSRSPDRAGSPMGTFSRREAVRASVCRRSTYLLGSTY